MEEEEKKVRIGVIGVGNMGYAHAKAIYENEIDTLCLSALCDTDEKRRELLQRDFPSVPVFDSYEKLLESDLCEAVVVATPHRFAS